MFPFVQIEHAPPATLDTYKNKNKNKSKRTYRKKYYNKASIS